MRFFFVLFMAILGLQLSGCYDFSRKIVQQGNLLPETKITKLKVGMSKENVAILMGNSLLSPTFNDNRWDYAYSLRVGVSKPVVKSFTLYFSHGVLARIEKHY